jgi:glycosyltransferase involved in cell wall biosynthesis
MAFLTDKSITLFFPAHNEIANLESIVRTAVELCQELSGDTEIIIVNDGSSDGTAALADRLARSHNNVRVIHHSVNRGYGGALQSGFRSASKELVFYTDGDGQFDLRDLRDVILLSGQADVVTCYRIDRQDPWYRLLNTWLFEKVVFLFLGLRVKDPDCAFKVYRREVLESINMTSEGAMIDVEMLLQAQRRGYCIVQRGVRHLPRKTGVSSGGNVRVIFRAMKEMVRMLQLYGSRFSTRHRKPSSRL